MESGTKIRDPDVKPKSFPLLNGDAKKHPHRTTTTTTTEADEILLYRECMKNHAASLGGHALDGCGEFMPSLSANPADPTSLKCAACGCHRNFHRRIIALRPRDDALEGEGEREGQDDEAEGEDEDEDEDEDEHDDADDDSRPKSLSPTPSPYFSSAPHMLLALSSGLRDGDSPSGQRKGFAIQAPVASVTPLRKRFRTKFSSEQKERMLELSERLGWRLQKRDEELVEKCCGEIGVGKGVFKVWMHNNKHQLFGQSGGAAARRGEAVAGVVSPSAAAGGDLGGGGGGGGVHKVDGNGNAMNGAC